LAFWFKTLRQFDKPPHQTTLWCGGKKKIDPAPFKGKDGTKRKIIRKRCGVDVILSETFPEKGIGFAIMHRLKKAANRKRPYFPVQA